MTRSPDRRRDRPSFVTTCGVALAERRKKAVDRGNHVSASTSVDSDKTRASSRLDSLLLVALVAAWFAWLACPSIVTASESSRLVWVFSYDETYFLKAVHSDSKKISITGWIKPGQILRLSIRQMI